MVTSLSALGSCRVVSPARVGCKKKNVQFNQTRNYGFVHSSAEVVQQIKFMLGEWTPTPEIWRFVSPTKQLDKIQLEKHDLSDTYIVEISSLKKISLNDDVVQLNYITRLFTDLFKVPEKSKTFWKLAEAGDQAQIDTFIGECVTAGLVLSDDVKDLRAVRLTNMTYDEVRQDIAWIVERLPRVVFVTHVDAYLPDRTLSPKRGQMIEMVKKAVAAEGGTVYDPTIFCRLYGQDNALEHNSTTHWAEPFVERIFDDMWEQRLSDEPAHAPAKTA